MILLFYPLTLLKKYIEVCSEVQQKFHFYYVKLVIRIITANHLRAAVFPVITTYVIKFVVPIICTDS